MMKVFAHVLIESHVLLSTLIIEKLLGEAQIAGFTTLLTSPVEYGFETEARNHSGFQATA